ncbi:Ca2+-binding RTX toxin-like protein [Inquilinus ginsengisoli]|uniref:beta strand repeat-containing protein n=1 Tax=Inquilinus ginsengisoli TaxID=363840 RepID=UPI003D1C103B
MAIIDGTPGDDDFIGTESDDTITGVGGNDTLSGLGGADTLKGGSGDDTLDGGNGNDKLSGETGIDHLIGGAGNDVLDGDGSGDVFEGGAGSADTLIFDGTVDLAAGTTSGGGTVSGVENVTGGSGGDTLTGDAGDNILIGDVSLWNTPGSYGDDVLAGGGGNDTLYGRGGADVLDGGSGDDQIYGGDTDQAQVQDILRGGDGDDALWDSGAWNGGAPDRLDGGAGNDTADYSGSFGLVVVDLAAGTVNGQVLLTGIENVRGANHVTGDAGANILTGRDGYSTILHGGAGDDRLEAYNDSSSLYGEAGDDVLYLSQGGVMDGGDGIDTADYSSYSQNVYIDLQLGIGPENDITLVSIENLIGTGFDNDTLVGDGGSNVIDGLAGKDSLQGGGGGDVLRGGAGADTLNGGAGSDTASYYTSAAGVTVDLAAGTGTGEASGDTFIDIENLTGSGKGNDMLSGTAGANILAGWGGNDLLRGGTGADTLDGGVGTDTATYYGSAAGVTVDLTAGTGTGGDAQGDTLIDVETVTGSNLGNDTLIGTAGANVLAGWGGSDVLRGGAGADRLDGGAGSDTASWYTSTAGVTVNLAAGTAGGGDAQGDTLIGIENLTGSNQGNDSLNGNAGANTLAGWGGADVLRGGAGADHLDGGAGSDTASYYNDGSGVTVNLSTGIGSGGNAQGDTYAGIENVTGSAGGDTIIGNALANVLNGWAGLDALVGGAGADRFVFSAASDSAVGPNADRITDFSHAQGDRVDLSAIDADTGSAGNQAFTFIGSALYSGVAGQLRAAVTAPGVTTIAGDVNGDGVSDFHLMLFGNPALVAADFVL